MSYRTIANRSAVATTRATKKACALTTTFVIVNDTRRNVYSESGLKDSQEGDEILLLFGRQFQFENQIEKLHRVVESQQSSVVEIRR
jgi:hypothetical protein